MSGKQLADVIIIGGGVMGCSLAYHLLNKEQQINLRIIERDSTYTRSSTTLSDGNIRVQFNVKENIQISQHGLEAIATFAEDMATQDYVPQLNFRQQGNIFIVNEESESSAREGLERQQSLGCEVSWIEKDEIQSLYPPLNAGGCTGATFGARDGCFSPLDMLLGYRRKAEELGAVVVEDEVVSLVCENGYVRGVILASGEILRAPLVANAAGAWAQSVAASAGVQLPVVPIKRQVFIVETDLHFANTLPLLLLPGGEYIIHEGGGHFIIGASFADDPQTSDDFSWSRALFEERLWEKLVEFLPAFDRLKLVNGWAGLYAVNRLDGNAILGEWPELKGFYLANGFSGHGLQQAPAVGRYLAELILGLPHELDLSVFSAQRILDNRPVHENPNRLI